MPYPPRITVRGLNGSTSPTRGDTLTAGGLPWYELAPFSVGKRPAFMTRPGGRARRSEHQLFVGALTRQVRRARQQRARGLVVARHRPGAGQTLQHPSFAAQIADGPPGAQGVVVPFRGAFHLVSLPVPVANGGQGVAFKVRLSGLAMVPQGFVEALACFRSPAQQAQRDGDAVHHQTRACVIVRVGEQRKRAFEMRQRFDMTAACPLDDAGRIAEPRGGLAVAQDAGEIDSLFVEPQGDRRRQVASGDATEAFQRLQLAGPVSGFLRRPRSRSQAERAPA